MAYTYDAGDGVVLDLRPVPSLILHRWSVEYDKKFPRPEPPRKEVEIGGKSTWEYDSNNPYYQLRLHEWTSRKESEQLDYIFSRYVVTDPPADFEVDEFFGDLRPLERKALWVRSIVLDVDQFVEDIMSIANVTTAAVEAAEKK